MEDKKKQKMIRKDMSFAEILENNPESIEILFRRGMHCIGCGMAQFETLEQGAMMHGIDANELVKEINNENKSLKKSANKKNSKINKSKSRKGERKNAKKRKI